MERISREHLKQGIGHYRKKSYNKAGKEFLTALRYNPGNREALDYVRKIYTKKSYKSYRVRKGDTIKSIASKEFNDSELSFLISYFNDLPKEAALTEGALLKLPNLETAFIFNTKKEMNNAKALYKSGKYDEVLALTEDVLYHNPEYKEALELINKTYYSMGRNLLFRKDYLNSIEVFEKVKDNYKDTKALILKAKKELKKMADRHYQRGVRFFINEKLGKAIKEWEKALEFYPSHKDANSGLTKARDILERLKR